MIVKIFMICLLNKDLNGMNRESYFKLDFFFVYKIYEIFIVKNK